MSELTALIKQTLDAYAALSSSQKLRHDYMQRRSFARGMCPWARDFNEYCAEIDKVMPHEDTLTDAEIGLILTGAGRAALAGREK